MATTGYRLKWEGGAAGDKAKDAAALALTRLGIAIVSEALPNTPVRTGTLRRSLHVAPPMADHYDDFYRAALGQQLNDAANDRAIAKGRKGNVICQVGTWLNYALIQELRNGYLMRGLESARGLLPALLARARFEVLGR